MTTEPLDRTARYAVASMPGSAFRFISYVKIPDTNWPYDDAELIDDENFARMVMVGDDHVHIIDTSDVTELEDGEYCSVCGQTGCTADAR
jgi:hypothetical protein